MTIQIGALVSNMAILQDNLLRSPIEGNLNFAVASKSAAIGLNKLLDRCEADVMVLVHQDVIFPEGWIERTEEVLSQLDNWGIAGVWGGNMIDGRFEPAGRIADTRLLHNIPLITEIWKGKMPCQVETLDEICLIINMKTGFRFDESLIGWDLYGAYACLRMQEMGYKTYVIDNAIIHNTKRPLKWKPGPEFLGTFKWLKDRFPTYRLVSTVYEEGKDNEDKDHY